MPMSQQLLWIFLVLLYLSYFHYLGYTTLAGNPGTCRPAFQEKSEQNSFNKFIFFHTYIIVALSNNILSYHSYGLPHPQL